MNSNSRLHLPPQRDRRGIALVITLLLLVLLSAFAVAFFTRMSVEQVSAASYADGVTTRQLAESAVGVVQSQIREATTITAADRHGVAWASQPGMIRTFAKRSGATPQTGKDNFAFYKLYSSDNMTITDANLLDAFDPLAEIDQDWAASRALWTDLNEPVRLKITDPTDQDKEVEIKRYPIFDPRLASVSDTSAPDRLSVHNTTNDTKIEGFSLDPLNGKTDATNANMPVRWIYVLRDGSLTAPTGSKEQGLIATWESADDSTRKAPTKTNPIVGRIAFWADDDTSKVNINTAGGFTTKDIDANTYDWKNDKSFTHFPGSFWDTPRFYTAFDRGGDVDVTKFGEPTNTASLGRNSGFSLALSQPVANEFQRFPGHPATTSLGLVFNRTLRSDGTIDSKTPRLTSQQIYRLLPRLHPGGTEGGADRQIVFNTTNTAYDASDKKMPLKAQRLYASVDEFFFAASQVGTRRQTSNEFLRTADTSDPRNPIPGITEDLIGTNDLEEFQAYRFFLTAHSRAPELNLFGRPRISMWPVWASTQNYAARRNPIDRLMMFCSTLGPAPKTANSVGKLFQFQRYQPYDPYEDVNIPRNTELLKSYLTGPANKPGLTDLPIPGFTERASFAAKYHGPDNIGSRDQILTEIFDYIRSGVNLRDTYFDRDYMGRTLSAAEQQTRDLQRYAPRGVVIPAAIKFPQSSVTSSSGKEVAGFGRFPTVSEVSLVFYHAGYIGDDGAPYFDPRDKNTRGVKENLIRMFLVVEGYNPMQGYCRTDNLRTKDDRNTRPNLITHVLEVTQPATISIPQPGGSGAMQVQSFQFPPGLLINEHFFRSGEFAGGADAGGMESVLHTLGRRFIEPGLNGPDMALMPPNPPIARNGGTTWDYNNPATGSGLGEYPFQSINAIRVPVDLTNPRPQSFQFGGFSATLRVRFGPEELQFINLNFPASSGMWPMPTDAYWEDPGGFAFPIAQGANPGKLVDDRGGTVHSDFETTWSGRGGVPWACALLSAGGRPCYPALAKSLSHRIWWINETYNNINGRAFSGTDGKFDVKGKELFDRDSRGFRFDNRWRNIIQPGDTVRSLVPAPAANTDLRTIAIMRSKNNESPAFEPLLPGYHSLDVRHVQANNNTQNPANPTSAMGTYAIQSQILRNSAGTPFVFSSTASTTTFGPNRSTTGITTTGVTAGSIEPRRLGRPGTKPVHEWVRVTYGPIFTSGGKLAFGNLANLGSTGKVGDYGNRAADLPASQAGSPVEFVKRSSGMQGDFDTGYGDKPDGPLCNKPDEGHLIWRVDRGDDDHVADPAVTTDWHYRYPYYISEYTDEPSETFFSPNRQVPSPVMFGSLLAGAKTGWQTLCFSPNPASLTASGTNSDGSPQTNHPGFDEDPKDHLFLDLFTMPVVEPYAISEPFSTAGKVNLNCEIVPFSYIRRTTALRAALHSTRLTAVETDQAKTYKTGALSRNYRLQVNRDETIKGIAARFSDTGRKAGDRFFKSASQICEHFLYPALASDGRPSGDLAGPKWDRNERAIRNFWVSSNLGGDNVREKPYADLYPRLTTKSNTFTVHIRVQKLRPQTGREDEDFLEWKETEDSVAAEYRGEVQVERYLDPQDRRFDLTDQTIAADEKFDVDATIFRTAQSNTRPLEHAYRFRTVGSKRFSPDR